MGGDTDQRIDQSIDRGTDGRTELRVHGVSGTPPESILGGFPLLKRVAGKDDAGFYRRWYPGGRSADLDAVAAGGRRLEAYSWGGLTSGSARRALWLLLLPFMLANVAHWMLPPAPPGPPRRAARLAVVLLRLLGLSLTLTMLLTAVQVAVDLAGWQCGRIDRCAESSNVLGLLSSGFLDTPGRRVAVTALVPLGVVLLFGVLGRQVPRTTDPEPDEAAPAPTDVPLARRSFWAGNPGMAVLRTLHIAAATAVLAALVAWPATKLAAEGVGRVLGLVVCVASLATALAATVLVAVEGVSGRERKADEPALLANGLRRLALGLLAVATLLSVWGYEAWEGAGRLPGLRPAVLLTFGVQLLLLLALFAAVAVQRPWRTGDGTFQIGMAGLGAPAVATLAFLVAGGFSAGLAYRVAELFGYPVLSQRTAAADLAAQAAVANDPEAPFAARLAAATAETPLVVPPSFAWAGAAATVVIAAVVVTLVVVAVRTLRRLPRLDATVRDEYGPGERPVRPVSRAVALASLTDGAGKILGAIVGVSVAVLLAGVVVYVARPGNWTFVEQPPLSTMTRFGTWAMGVFALGLVVLFWNAYRNPALRRTVGILWDVGSFWPRATHPLAPPSYGERAVPDLAGRVTRLTAQPTGRVLLSGHSQGSVLVAAAVLLLDGPTLDRVALLTHGSPLRRLFARFFPAYVGPATLLAVERAVEGRWRNCYRDTDPVGSWVFEPLRPGGQGRVDRRLRDPRELGEEVEGHSDYWTDAGYAAAAEELQALRSSPAASTAQ